MGGCTARYAYEIYGKQEWLGAVVSTFLGLGFIFMSLTGFVSVFTYYWDTDSCDDKVKVFYAFLLGIPTLVFGVIYLWKGLMMLLV